MTTTTLTAPTEHACGPLLAAGHTACTGCGEALAAKLVLGAAGRDIIVTDATGCLEVFTTRFPQSSWEVPFIHSLFENSAAVASGIEAALRALGRQNEAKVIAQGGDGGTADIGLQALSGMLERGHDILYVCYDNEAYMNTGVQRSGLTPFDCMTTTSPYGEYSWGNKHNKKDMPSIAAAHGIPYVATASVAFPKDIENKVKKALSITGPKYIQIHSPCPLGWRSNPQLTIKVAKLAIDTGLYPVFEMENGKITKVRKVKNPKVPVEEYLKIQGRFAHLFKSAKAKEEIQKIQEIADRNIEKYGLA
ncbi:MAG: pyruvate ferredoxin oxidoreductase [Candidatus Jettenia sp.]|uniref:Pyruvate ferredoxin oxidoreductase beta subunit n=1 Tax=Candidatus Jettenia caeni TaxID=247490 RepID=I3IKB1_9BACT|nr:MAG: pyruvate ferredoxin oxidoreductase [Candidatus Jettenia sp. AMX1]MBC6929946.1 pyruvate ferredoxin oxidoreductase [Candidatus Jettenia sp.]NUN23656.1 pyruvate ferredoxin oxidoreductase [Candidatus Jettenia caeni]MCE7881600.1 pyruvate ferredoxin oxidoreductase [Candidatus Jettenia sp. AMX1]MCQ3928222.1 pyruvate ferredoxin oxidoreductase [Candidatus Jettenia sp.]